MNVPVWDVPLRGGGLLIAIVASLPFAGAWYVSRIPDAARLHTIGGSPAVRRGSMDRHVSRLGV
jgi:hypothetical protein